MSPNPELIETYRGAVYPWHCDHMGHMNVMWYVGKFDEATWHLFASMGVTDAFLKGHRHGRSGVWCVGKSDEATCNLFASMGVTAAFLKDHRRGMAAVQQNITYKRELHA